MRNGLFISLLMAFLSLLPIHAQDGLRPRGDVNCDWAVTIADVNAVIEAVLQGTPYHSFYTYAHDVNRDHAINISDVNAIIEAVMGHQLSPMPGYSGTLPLLFINTDGHVPIVSKEEYVDACWWLDAQGIAGCESVGSAQEPLRMQIKGRGNYSWTDSDKKPFRLKLEHQERLLGMPASRHWVLLANALSQKGQVENTLPYEIGRRMGMAWNPHMEPVEVVLNGQYIGLYFLAEKIRVSRHRVNIEEQNDYEVDPECVTGGWLLEINNYDEAGNITFIEGNGKPFWVLPHSPEGLSDVQLNYITAFLMAADTAIYCSDKGSTEWERYIDIDSLALYYVVQEIVDNPEAFSGSCYMFKHRGEDTKLIFGPLWDCDHSYYRYGRDYQPDFIYHDVKPNWYSRWIGEIAKFPHFQERVRHYWKLFYENVYPGIDAYLDAFSLKLQGVWRSNYKRWPQYVGNYNIPYRIELYARPAFHKKVAWLQTQWGQDSIDD